MKKFLRIRKDKRDQVALLRNELRQVYLQHTANQLQEYVAEDMAWSLYKKGWRRT